MNNGELAEWLMAPVLKTGIPGRVSGVRIPHSPPLLSRTAGPDAEMLSRSAAYFFVLDFSSFPPSKGIWVEVVPDFSGVEFAEFFGTSTT